MTVAVRAFRDEQLSDEDELRWLWVACRTARALGDYEAWDELTARHLELARRAGAFSLLPVALADRVVVELASGSIGLATSLAAESDAVIEATGGHLVPRASIMLANWRGRDAEARALIEARERDLLRDGEGLWFVANEYGSVLRYNGLGRYEEALAAAERAAENPRGLGLWIRDLFELIEAAVRSGHPERAAGPLEQLREIAHAAGTDWALGSYARAAAMLAEGETAERLYCVAIERLSRTRGSETLARAHLLYGEWLRREHRRVDAREQLRVAHAMLADVGMEAELLAGTDAELAEHVAQMPLDCAGAEEQLGADLRVRLPAGRQARDLHLLRSQLAERLDRAPAHCLAGGQQLATGALGEALVALSLASARKAGLLRA